MYQSQNRHLASRQYHSSYLNQPVNNSVVWHGTVEFNIALDTLQVISEAIFPANHLTASSKTKHNYNQVTTQKNGN